MARYFARVQHFLVRFLFSKRVCTRRNLKAFIQIWSRKLLADDL